MGRDQERDAVHVTRWGPGEAGDAPRVLLVHGTLSWGTDSFREQRPLADRFRLELMDRRGFGRSPDIARSDYERDAEDIADALGSGAHLVAHSYGAAGAMIAAARRPGAVRSLTLIEPSTLRVAGERPAVAAALARIREAFGERRAPMSPEEFLRHSTEEYGLPLPELTPGMLRATASAMGERPAWDADIPLAALGRAGWPKLVVNGTWESAHPGYRAFSGEALMACGAFVAERIGARHVRVPGCDHSPHRDRPGAVNRLLAGLWSGRSEHGTPAGAPAGTGPGGT
ncbi:alpha/beta fold hydrolase [Streptomyces fuscigenes]|uniref:alpha/beta fold hydrolase n=1 Tax=Streptomyces fuscigenes TaxID=1528880 RepID=UPI001F454179|nr:alpha/beta hydrolase [Streptomyces fuscigenes]MCF3964870.1 alpha/beta hydrolase [Streptomyces fuscigenes]